MSELCHRVDIGINDDSTKEERRNWIQKNCNKSTKSSMARRYYFVDKDEAFQFMMMFGGDYKKVNIRPFDLAVSSDHEFQEKMKLIFKDFFDDNPDVKLVTWSQYTPHFNDGSTCVFGMNDIIFSRKTWSDGGWDEMYNIMDDDEAYVKTWYFDIHTESISNLEVACKELENVLGSFESTFEHMFGDHCQVLIEEHGIWTQEYDHE